MELSITVNYALKNLSTHRRRSLLLIGCVVLCVSVSIVAESFAAEAYQFWIAATTESGTGDAQLYNKKFDKDTDAIGVQNSLTDSDEAVSLVRQNEAVLATAPRLNFEGIISRGSRSMFFLGQGVSPADETKVSPRLLAYDGNNGGFVNDAKPRAIVIGRGLADSIGASVGDTVTLTANTSQQNLNAIDTEIIGVVNYPEERMSKRLVYVHITLAQELIQLPKRFSEIALRLKKPAFIDSWYETMSRQLENSNVIIKPWYLIFPPIRKVETIWKAVLALILGLLFLSSTISILTVLFLIIHERRIEIGVLRALGVRQTKILALILTEAGFVGVSGALLGLLLGNITIAILHYFGIAVVNPFFNGYFYLHPRCDPVSSVAIGFAAICATMIATIPPALRALRIDPVMAFRGQI